MRTAANEYIGRVEEGGGRSYPFCTEGPASRYPFGGPRDLLVKSALSDLVYRRTIRLGGQPDK